MVYLALNQQVDFLFNFRHMLIYLLLNLNVRDNTTLKINDFTKTNPTNTNHDDSSQQPVQTPGAQHSIVSQELQGLMPLLLDVDPSQYL